MSDRADGVAGVVEPAVLHPTRSGRAPWWAGPAGLVLGAVLAAAAYVGAWPLLVTVLVVQGALSIGWLEAIGAPGSRGGQVVLAAAGLAADLTLLITRASRPGAVMGVLGLVVLAVVIHQLARRGGRLRVVRSLTAAGSGAFLVVLIAMLLPLREIADGPPAVAVSALAAGLCAALARLALPGWSVLALSLSAGACLGALVGTLAEIGSLPGAGLGAGVALAAAVGAGLARRSASRASALAAALPLATAAPAGYLLARVLLG